MGIFDSSKKKKPEERSEERRETPPEGKPAPGIWQVGDKIQNRYKIHHILGGPGKSGMGIVYVCYDHESKVPVAIKTFQDKYLRDRASIDRFRWEAETWVRLEKHYNIVRARYVEEIEGRPYIFLEYIVGGEQYGADLSGWIWGGGLQKGGKPDIPLILNFAIQFCHGMIHAQRKFEEMGKLFVHRDIKPQNIMITRDRVVKITDFGLVRAFIESDQDIPLTTVEDKSRKRLSLSKLGNVCGTPPYMSPEQCRGSRDIDIRSDIYAFGCVLYEMLTQRYVFDARTPEEFIKHHLMTLPESPKAYKELDKVVMKCLEKEPVKRYQGFEEVEKVLSRVYHDVTGEVMKLPEAASLEAWELNEKGTSLVSLGFNQEGIECYQQALRINPNVALAHNNLGIAYKAQGKLDAAVAEYEEAVRINSNLALAHNNLGDGYYAQGKLDAAVAEFREALRINPNNALAHNNLGVAYEAQGKLDAAVAEFREAMRINPNNALAHYNLGNAYKAQGKLDATVAEYREALRINPNYANAHYNLGNAYEAQGKLDAAVAEYEEAVRINPNLALAHSSLGIAYAAQGKLDAAVAEFREAVRINPNNAEAHNNLGVAHKAQGKLDAAVAESREAVRINPNNALAHYNLGNAYKAQGKLDAAVAEYKEVLRINPNDAGAHTNLGNVYKAQGKYKEAIESYQAFIRLAPAQYASYVKQAEEAIHRLKQMM